MNQREKSKVPITGRSSGSSMFRSLRVRNYRLFAIGQIISLTGSWMQRVAQDWLVLGLSHDSGTALGLTTALQFLPLAVFGLYGGVIADRTSKRKLLLVSQASMGVLALILGLTDLFGLASLHEVYLLALLLGMASALDMPTRQAFVSELVGPEAVGNAVALNSATFNVARILGPAVAGSLISATGTPLVFLLNSVSFVAVIAVLLAMRQEELHVGSSIERRKGQMRAGLAYVLTNRDLLLIVLLAGVVGTFGFNFQVVLALVDKSVFHKGALDYGILSAVLAAGSLAGALVAAKKGRPTERTLVLAAACFGLGEVALAFASSYWMAAVMLVPTGFAGLLFSTTANSAVQMRSDPLFRGRAMAVYLLVFMGGTPLGAPVVGWMAQTWGVQASLFVTGTMCLGAAVAAALVVVRRRKVAL